MTIHSSRRAFVGPPRVEHFVAAGRTGGAAAHWPRLRGCAAIIARMRTAALAVALMGAAGAMNAHASSVDDSLYRAFGGEAGMQSVVDDFVAAVHEDPRTRSYFAKASDKRLRVMLAKQFCVVAGGPCVYNGSSMKAVHSNLKIDRAAFNAVVEVLQGAMDRQNVPFHVQNRLLAKLAPLYREIETR